MFKVNALNSFYHSTQVLWDISFKINQGQIVGLFGANGAGKTTTLNSVMGLVKHTGQIEFLGKEIERMRTDEIVKLGISIVPEGRHIFPKMAVRENLLLGAYSKKLNNTKNKLNEIYALFPDLKEKEQTLAGLLSGGQQQMLAIARALMAEPKLLMLDEPLQGLSPLYQQKVLDTLKQLKGLGISILLVEQSLEKVLKFVDYIYVIRRGRNILEGSPKALTIEEIKLAYFGK
jgi:branched-chain amino acid transport system ATP-binding protein